MKNFLIAVLTVMNIAIPGISNSATWPSDTIKIVVPFGPGGPNDVIARELAKRLNEKLGQPVVVDNKPGAAGMIGSNFVATSSNNGYTYLFNSGGIAMLAATKKTPYDTKKSFESIAIIGETPFILITRKDFPAKDLKELIAYAKANPGKVNYGTAGKGDAIELVTENFSRDVGIKMNPIPYKGANPAMLDLLAGHIDIMFTSPATVKGAAAENLPKLAVTSNVRSPEFPNLPTIKEQTGKPYVFNIWFGVFGPAGIDKNIVNRMNSEINKIVTTPEFIKFLNDRGIKSVTGSPGELQSVLVKDVDRWTNTAKSIGIQPE